MVPIRPRREPSRRHLVAGQPSKSCIRRFMVHLGFGTPPGDEAAQLPITVSKFGGWPAYVLLKWVIATLLRKTLEENATSETSFIKTL